MDEKQATDMIVINFNVIFMGTDHPRGDPLNEQFGFIIDEVRRH